MSVVVTSLGALILKHRVSKERTHCLWPVVWSAVLFVCVNAAGAADHACTDCHNSATPSASDLVKPLSALCADCHAERIAAGEHVVDIPVSSPGNTLPLQNGLLTCATCHDPHQPLAAPRIPDPELCMQCHPH